MKAIALIGLLSVSALISTASADTAKPKGEFVPETEIITSTILTQADQSKLTPEAVLEILKQGNAEYIDDSLTVRNNSERVREAALGQYPMAVVLSCLDSRVPVEDVFHRGIGDLFVARVAGNIVNVDIIGSMEFACKVSGSKLVVVLGHENCGAVRAAIQGVELGNITELLAKIQPAVKEAAGHFHGDATASNPAFVEAVCDDNVLIAMQQIREQSPILKGMEDNGEIMIVGGVYDLKTGKVEFFDHK
ncbi:carbonic anhydrase [Ruficoccus amylovorans]|uniref:Carbonic anhydrase n=1 Tax=Ruficoccus amylovorans TaxID=1804625 RepID=A0A842HAT3_9BACT|nr:carbonic anhydrase family protein [Ruficoccus amylovorans]MBC2593188.1 carbonic anhydrase [Ruficoccus amylovorans]